MQNEKIIHRLLEKMYDKFSYIDEANKLYDRNDINKFTHDIVSKCIISNLIKANKK